MVFGTMAGLALTGIVVVDDARADPVDTTAAAHCPWLPHLAAPSLAMVLTLLLYQWMGVAALAALAVVGIALSVFLGWRARLSV